MSEGPVDPTPRRGRRSPQLQAELAEAAARRAEEDMLSDELGTNMDGQEQVGMTFVRTGTKLFLKAALPYDLDYTEETSYFTTAIERHIEDGTDLGDAYEEMREIVLEANFGLAVATQTKLHEAAQAEQEPQRRSPIRPR